MWQDFGFGFRMRLRTRAYVVRLTLARYRSNYRIFRVANALLLRPCLPGSGLSGDSRKAHG